MQKKMHNYYWFQKTFIYYKEMYAIPVPYK